MGDTSQIRPTNLLVSGTPYVDIRAMSPTVDLSAGAVSAVAALTAAAAIGSPVLIPPGTYLIDSSYSCTASLIMSGGKFSVTSGATLTINGSLNADLTQIFDGGGAVAFGYGSVREVFPQWWGAVGDGETDCHAAILAAIVAANGIFPVMMPAGVYLSSDGFTLDIAKTQICGYSDGLLYGPSAARTTIKFTGGTVGFSNGATAYMKLRDLSIDGNDVLEVGWDGAFLVSMENVSLINCTVAGLRADNISQTSRFVNCAFSGNLDGFQSLDSSAIGTLCFDRCLFRENTRYGVYGNIGSGSVMVAPIFESNGDVGVYLKGDAMRQVTFLQPYFEQNDSAASPAYNLKVELDAASGRVVFEGGIFGSTGVTKVANIVSGSVEFRNCSQTGERTSDQLTVAAGAEVILHNSFDGYAVPENVKSSMEAPADRHAALNFVGGLFAVNALSLSFGAADFAVQATISANRSTQSIRPIITGDLNGFDLFALGGTAGVYALALAKTGAAAFAQTDPVNLRPDEPAHVAYSRVSNVGTLWLNGRIVWTGGDANNYSGDQLYIGHNYSATVYGEFRAYSMSFHDEGLSAAEVTRLWRNGGDIDRSGLRSTATFNLDTTNRFMGKVLDDVSGTFMAILGTAAWDNPLKYMKGVAATVADGGTIAHELGVAPSVALAVGSVAGEMVSVTGIDATNITVAIKKHDNSAGTTQTIYWQAFI